jgi:hypothetical protein
MTGDLNTVNVIMRIADSPPPRFIPRFTRIGHRLSLARAALAGGLFSMCVNAPTQPCFPRIFSSTGIALSCIKFRQGGLESITVNKDK